MAQPHKMVDKKPDTNRLAKVSPEPKSEKPKKQKVFFSIFVSFDIINSTNWKNYDPKWPKVLQQFFTVSHEMLIKTLSDDPHIALYIWKTVGDEILFSIQIKKSHQISRVINDLHKLQSDLKSFLEDQTKPNRPISLKSTSWCALLSDISDKFDYETKLGHNYRVDFQGKIDFLGPQIDQGFRISKYSVENSLLISFDLAYLFAKYADPEKDFKLHCIGEEKLKGVWGGEKYPLIFLLNDQQSSKSFRFQEKSDSDKSEFIKYINDASENNKEVNFRFLRSIAEEQSIISRLESICEKFNEDGFEIVRKASSSRPPVHISPIIAYESTFLLLKRSPDKDFAPSVWEFPCGQLENGESDVDCCKRTILEDYGLEINGVFELLKPYYVEKQWREQGFFYIKKEFISEKKAQSNQNKCRKAHRIFFFNCQ